MSSIDLGKVKEPVILRSAAQGAPVHPTVAISSVGVRCRVGDDPGPFTWYRAKTLTAWEVDGGSGVYSGSLSVGNATTRKIVAAGDSLTAVTQAFGGDSWFTLLQARVEFASGATFVNTAVSSRRLGDLAAGYATEVYPHRPTGGITSSILYLWVGANDSKAGISQDETWFSRYTAYVSTAVADGFVVRGVTIIPWKYRTVKEADFVRRMNQHIRANSQLESVFDAEAFFPDAFNSNLFHDPYHIGQRGAKLFADAIQTQAKSLSVRNFPIQTFEEQKISAAVQHSSTTQGLEFVANADEATITPAMVFGTNDFFLQIPFRCDNLLTANPALIGGAESGLRIAMFQQEAFPFLTRIIVFNSGQIEFLAPVQLGRDHVFSIYRKVNVLYAYLDGKFLGSAADAFNYTGNTNIIGNFGGSTNYFWGRIGAILCVTGAIDHDEVIRMLVDQRPSVSTQGNVLLFLEHNQPGVGLRWNAQSGTRYVALAAGTKWSNIGRQSSVFIETFGSGNLTFKGNDGYTYTVAATRA